jgi:hypothetical protein
MSKSLALLDEMGIETVYLGLSGEGISELSRG